MEKEYRDFLHFLSLSVNFLGKPRTGSETKTIVRHGGTQVSYSRALEKEDCMFKVSLLLGDLQASLGNLVRSHLSIKIKTVKNGLRM